MLAVAQEGAFQSLKKQPKLSLASRLHIFNRKPARQSGGVGFEKERGIWEAGRISWKMQLSCIMGNVGSSDFRASLILGTKCQDISTYEACEFSNIIEVQY